MQVGDVGGLTRLQNRKFAIEKQRMNDRYFACPNCRVYIDAGYRWAYWLLEEPGHVTLNDSVDVSRLLAVDAYWNPPREEGNAWLSEEVLPRVKAFFAKHREHGIIYLEIDTIITEESLWYNWTQIENAETNNGCAKDTGGPASRKPNVRPPQR